MSGLLTYMDPVSSSQPSPPACQVCSVIFFLDLFCSGARNECVLMDPVKPGGIRVCLTAGGCWTAQGLNGLTVHPSGTTEILGMEQEQQGEIFYLGGGKVCSLCRLLHCITLIWSFDPDLSKLNCGHSLDDREPCRHPLRRCAADGGFPSLGIRPASPKHSAVLQKPPPYATVT